jgi:GH15 family glucan-1,4-alpha-glucosidase
MYGIDGRHDLSERTLDHLSGYRDSAPVRIGNGAYDQTQLDIYGELLYAVDLYDELVEPVSYALWQQLSQATEWVCAHWRDTDEGIWEVRGGQREFIYSRLTDWVAMDRAIRIAQRRSLPAPLARWTEVRDEIHHEIYHGFWSEKKQAFVQYKGAETLDASALMMPLVGFIASRDPRWLSTLAAIEDELVDDALVYRYHPEAPRPTGSRVPREPSASARSGSSSASPAPARSTRRDCSSRSCTATPTTSVSTRRSSIRQGASSGTIRRPSRT